MIKYDLTGSLVLYENSFESVKKAVDSFLTTTLKAKLQIIDNSPENTFSDYPWDNRCDFIYNDHNPGFGRAHNQSIRTVLETSKYHLVLNPDVSFDAGTLEKLYDFMEKNPTIGLVIPEVLNTKGQRQPACKRLPAPLDLILRRFGFGIVANWFNDRLNYYEMNDKNYSECFEAPYLSGCFMFFRVEALKKTGLFDERFFLYMEDVDISRRMFTHYRNVYYPHAHIYHEHARESYKTNKYLFAHIISAIKYFNKWGWLFDRERKRINTGL